MRWKGFAALGAAVVSWVSSSSVASAQAQAAPKTGTLSSAPSAPSAPSASSAAEPPIPERRFVLNNLVGFRYNPLGLEDQLRAGFQQKIYKSEKKILRDNFFFGGVAPRVNPAFVKVGPSIEIQPISIFNLRIGAEFIGYFSTFGFLQSFRSPVEEFSESVLKQRRDAKLNYAAHGLHVIIEPMVQFRFGKILVRDKLSIEHWRVKLRPGDRVFYDVTLDTTIGSVGWVMQNDADMLFLHEFGARNSRIAAGVRYTYVQPFYDSGDFAPGDDKSLADNDHHRVGPLVAFTFFDDGYSRFNKPTAILIANWYASHRFRTGADTSGALPYLILGFSFQSDLLD